MANQVETQPGTALQVSEGGQITPAAMFQAVMSAASDARVDPAKMTALVDLQIKVMDYQKQEEFNRDKIGALKDMPSIGKKGQILNKNGGIQSRYSRFEDMHAAVKPILDRHNLAISFNVGHQGNLVTVTPILSHTNGHVEKGGDMALPIDTTGSKNATQGAGSAASYGKRHSMKAMLNIVEVAEDDDGKSTGTAQTRELNEGEELLVNDGRAAAKKGGEAYEAWFRGLESPQRGWLVVSGKHDLFKRDAGLA